MLKTGFNILEFNILYILAHAAIQSYIYRGFTLSFPTKGETNS